MSNNKQIQEQQLLNEFLDSFLQNPFGFMFGAHFLQSILGGGGPMLGELEQYLQDQPDLLPMTKVLQQMDQEEIESLQKEDPKTAAAIQQILSDMPEGMQSAMMDEIQLSSLQSFGEVKDSFGSLASSLSNSMENVLKVEPMASMNPEQQKVAVSVIKEVAGGAFDELLRHFQNMDRALAKLIEDKDSPVSDKVASAAKKEELGTFMTDTHPLKEISGATTDMAMEFNPAGLDRAVYQESSDNAEWTKKLFAKVDQSLSMLEEDLQAFGNYMSADPPPFKITSDVFMKWFNGAAKIIDRYEEALHQRLPNMVARETGGELASAKSTAPKNLEKLADKDKIKVAEETILKMKEAQKSGDAQALKDHMEVLKVVHPKLAQQASKKFGIPLQESLRNFYESFGDFS